jgi:hypothetical protein
MTTDDVHAPGFLLPGESGGRHARTEATDAPAEVKVSIINRDSIHVVIDPAIIENATPVTHARLPGVHHALTVIPADDGTAEVCRKQTSHLHNDIRMPDGSHGRQFTVKVSFFRHADDEPKSGTRQTFSMPLTVAALDRQHHEDVEAHLREVERHR